MSLRFERGMYVLWNRISKLNGFTRKVRKYCKRGVSESVHSYEEITDIVITRLTMICGLIASTRIAMIDHDSFVTKTLRSPTRGTIGGRSTTLRKRFSRYEQIGITVECSKRDHQIFSLVWKIHLKVRDLMLRDKMYLCSSGCIVSV